jgi:acyl dehydratase
MSEPLRIPDVASLSRFEGVDLGATPWQAIEQSQIDAFADATGDRQWIHVDPERAAAESPFGTTIAHGYLTLALAPALLPELVEVENCSRIVNSGVENLRMREPVPAGSRIRLAAQIKSVRPLKGGSARLSLSIRFELEGAQRPVCTGVVVYVYFP